MVTSDSPFKLARSSVCHSEVGEENLFLLLTTVQNDSLGHHSIACCSPKFTFLPHYSARVKTRIKCADIR